MKNIEERLLLILWNHQEWHWLAETVVSSNHGNYFIIDLCKRVVFGAKTMKQFLAIKTNANLFKKWIIKSNFSFTEFNTFKFTWSRGLIKVISSEQHLNASFPNESCGFHLKTSKKLGGGGCKMHLLSRTDSTFYLAFTFLDVIYLNFHPALSQELKHLSNERIIFKVNNKDTRITK